jgi:hypothetical protein
MAHRATTRKPQEGLAEQARGGMSQTRAAGRSTLQQFLPPYLIFVWSRQATQRAAHQKAQKEAKARTKGG